MADLSASLLCSACKIMFSGPPRRAVAGAGNCYEHHLPPYKLEAAAKQNCYVCTRLWEALLPSEQSLVRSTSWIAGNCFRWRPLALLLLFFGLGDCMDGCYGWSCNFAQSRLDFVFGPSASGWKTISFDLLHADDPYVGGLFSKPSRTHEGIPGSPVRLSVRQILSNAQMAANTNSESTWQAVHDWYHQSLEAEDINRNATLPRRLLDLKCLDVSQARLSLDKEEREHSPYATLSYQWGPNPESMKQLTRLGVDAMARSININALPRIFQEAMEATRRLGIRYLWIDALCIVQDDPQDLADECSVMDEIYRGAICNIAAGVGDRNSGLFAKRQPNQVRPLLVDLRWRGFGFGARRYDDYDYMHGPFFILERNYRPTLVLSAPLSCRAWVLQERLLSPRTLHFGRDQVFWESERFAACECFPQGYPKPSLQMNFDEMAPIRRINKALQSQRHIEDNSHYFIREWNEIIRMYSKCAITKESDKLVALSGLARHTHKGLNSYTYHAGLWSCEMLQSLLWRIENGKAADGSPSKRLHHASVPSWSWLSVNGVVEPRDPLDPVMTRRPLAEIVTYVTIPISLTHPFGNVDKAHIVMSGCLVNRRSAHWPLFGDNLELTRKGFSISA